MTMDCVTLDVPDERDLPPDDALSRKELRAMELIDVFGGRVEGGVADERAMQAEADRRGWHRLNSTLLKLQRHALVASVMCSLPARPRGANAPKTATLWSLTNEGRIEHFAQRGRVFQ